MAGVGWSGSLAGRTDAVGAGGWTLDAGGWTRAGRWVSSGTRLLLLGLGNMAQPLTAYYHQQVAVMCCKAVCQLPLNNRSSALDYPTQIKRENSETKLPLSVKTPSKNKHKLY